MAFGKSRDNEDKGGIATAFGLTKSNEVVLGKGCKVVGTLQLAGNTIIDGTVEGEIISQDRLTIGESANIKAKISGADIVIKGTVHGDIIASKRIILEKTAKVLGNIQAPSLGLEEGVVFEGKASTGSRSSEPVRPVASPNISQIQAKQTGTH